MADANDNNLSDMIDQLINNEPDQAEQCFHDYLKPKIQSVITPQDDNNNIEDQQ